MVTYVRQSRILSLSRFIAFLAFVFATMVVRNLHPLKRNLVTLVFYTRGVIVSNLHSSRRNLVTLVFNTLQGGRQ